MFTRFFAALLTIGTTTAYGQSQTYEQKQAEKLCAGVPEKTLGELREFVRAQPVSASHGRIVIDTREWVKGRGEIPDKCVTAMVRMEVAARQSKQDTEKRVRLEREEAENRAAWQQLTDLERLWIAASSSQISLAQLRVGAIGYFGKGLAMQPISILSESEMIVNLEPADDRNGSSIGAWITGLDASGYVDDQRYRVPVDVPFLIPRTISYQTAIGGTRTVFYIERIYIDSDKLRSITVPAGAIVNRPVDSIASEPPRLVPAGRTNLRTAKDLGLP